jgi:histone deacetylase 1/2
VSRLAALYGATLRSGDIPAAYLNADIDPETEIYITQPRGFEVKGKEDWVYQLNKALYGLKQAGKLWYDLLSKFLAETGFKRNVADPCLFHKREKDDVLVIAITVDDFLYFGTCNNMIDELVSSLEKRFKYIDDDEANWFLGMNVVQNYDHIAVDQADYIKTIVDAHPDIYPRNTPGAPSKILEKPTEPTSQSNASYPYRKLCGQLRYATLTRPEIEHPLNQCCKFQEKFGDAQIKALEHIVGYLKKFPYRPLTYKKDYTTNPICKLSAFADSSFADQDGRRSSYGFIVRMNGKVLTWKGRTTPEVATSSSGAEYVAISDTLKEMLHSKYVLEDLGFQVEIPMLMCSDSQGAIGIAKFPKIHNRSKHIDIRYHFTREKIDDGTLRLQYVPTNENEADIFTKNLPATKMNYFLASILEGKPTQH